MSHHRDVYVGTYLHVTEATTVTTVDHCAGHDRGDAKFCPECGLRKTSRMDDAYHRPSDDYWDDDDYIDRLVERLGDDDGFLAYSNFGKGGLGLHNESPGAFVIPDRAACEAEFLAEHQRDVARLRELGCTVTIEFGILAWVS